MGTVAPTKLTLVLVALLKFSADTWLMLQAMAHCMGALWHSSNGGSTPWVMLSTAEETSSVAGGDWDSWRGGREGLKPAGI